MNLIKKLFVFTMIFSMVFFGVGIGNMQTVKAVDVSNGDLVRSATNAGVYYVYTENGTQKRAAFPDSKTYFSWYEDFSGVKVISTTELANISYTGKLITYRPGTKMIKIDTDPKVYAVEPGGVLRWVNSEATALALYGANWATMINDVPDAFFGWYDGTTAISNPVTATAHPEGTLIRYTGTDDVYYIDGTNQKRLVSAAGFTANKFSEDYVVENVSDAITYTDGAAITAAETALFPITAATIGGVTPPAAGGDVSVSLSSSSPASMTVPAGSSNTFAVFNFTAGDEDASISSIKLTMPTGILGDPEYVDSITVYDNGVKIGSSKNMNSTREALFNFSTPIVVSAGATKALTIKATIQATKTGRFALGIASASSVVIDGGSITGTFPINGKEMTAVADATIGTVAMSNVDSNNLTGIQFGEQNIKLAGFTLSTTNEASLWESIRFKNAGTNDPELFSNLRLLIDGDEVAQGTIDGRYVSFNLNNYVITKGDSINVEVYGDIGIGSVGNTIDLYIEDKSDMSFIGQDYGYGISITSIDTLNASDDGIKVTLAAGDFTIAMDKTVTPAKDIVAGTNDVVLATIKMTSNGENATINSIKEHGADEFVISGTGLACNELDAVELKDLNNGSIYDVTLASSTLTATKCGLVITEEMTLLKGVTHTFQLRADIQGPNDTYSADALDTYQVTLLDTAFDITGETSNASITGVTPGSITSAITTVRGGALNWTTVALNAISVVGGAGSNGTEVVLYKAYLEVGDASDLKLQSVKVNTNGNATAVDGAFSNDNLSQVDLYIVENGVSRLLKSTNGDITEVVDGVSEGYINFTSLNTTNRTLKKGVDVYLEVRGIFASAVTTGAFDLELGHASTFVVVQDTDNNNVAENIASTTTQSRVVTVAAKGTLMAELKTTSTNANDDTYILAGTTTSNGRYLGEIEFTTTNEPIKITDLALQEYGDSTGADVKLVKLFDSTGALVAYKAPDGNTGYVHFEDTDFLAGKATLPADQKTSYFIGVEVNGMNVENDAQSTTTFNHGIQYSFATSAALAVFTDLGVDEAVKAQGVDSGEAITIVEDGNGTIAAGEYSLGSVKSKTASTTGAILTSVVNVMSDGALTGGTGKIIGKYKFVFNNGSNRTATNAVLKAQLRTLILNVATSTGVDAVDFQAYVEGNSGDKTAVAQVSAGEVTIDLVGGFDTDTELVDGEITIVIIANLTVGADSQNINTEIDDLSTDFTYNGNNGSGSVHWSDAKLEGITDVLGGTLSKS